MAFCSSRRICGSSGSFFSNKLRLPSTAISRLLKSCATPPVKRPIVSIFCASNSCANASSRSRVRSSIRSSNSSLNLRNSEVRVELLELPGFAVQIDEYPDLGAQQLRHHRHRHVVNAAQFVAAQLIEVRQHDRGYENDGSVLKARVFANHRGQFKAIQIRHAHIDED